jgi:plastocyanin
VHRRALLRRAAPLAVVGLAGCSGGSNDTGGTDTTEEPTDGEPTTAESTTAATTPGATTTAEPTTATEATTAEPTTTTAAARSSVTVTVAPEGNLRFDPDSFTLSAGGTVTWEWDSSGHNVRPSQKPEGVNWAGSPQPPNRTFDAGYTYDWSFQQAGEYAYFCQPHQDFGMVGSFRVEQFP